MFRKVMLVAAAVGGLMLAGGTAQAGHCHHGHSHGRGYGYGGYHGGPYHSGYSYRGGYGGGYGYSSGVVVVPRYVPAPVYPGYGNPYGGYPYGSYGPYGPAFGLQTGNFSLYLGR